MSDQDVSVRLTVRQAAAIENLFETGLKVKFQGVVSRDPLDMLTEEEMVDLLCRIRTVTEFPD